jgi:hypothetical protein
LRSAGNARRTHSTLRHILAQATLSSTRWCGHRRL